MPEIHNTSASPFVSWFPNYPASIVPKIPIASAAFGKYFEAYGGRSEPAPEEDVLLGAEWFRRRFWDYLTKFQRVPLYKTALGNAYFDYIHNPHLNAALGSSEEFVFVGLFLGAFRNVATFFQVILSHPDVLPEVGDPSKQTKWFEDLASWNWNLSVALAFDSFRTLRGTAPTFAKGARTVFAGYLTMFAMDFLFFHELGHWCNGHDRARRKLGFEMGAISEELDSPRVPAVLHMLLELDADSFAVNLMTNEWFQVQFGPTSIFRSAHEALRVWTIAIAFTFMLMGQERRIHVVRPLGLHPHPDLIGQHPHPALRLVNARHAAMNIASLFSYEAASTMAHAAEEGLAAVRQVCERLKIPSSIWYADEETAMRTYQAISMEWAAIYQPEVEACTRLNLRKANKSAAGK